MRVADQPGFILHHHPYRETSLLLEVLTRDFGRVGLVAKGARRAKTDVRALLVPFQPLIVGWGGGGELGTLSQVEPGPDALELSGRALFCGFYLNELMLRLLARHDPCESLFAVYAAALRALGAGGGEEAALRVFEKRLLHELGYGLVLDRDAAGAPVEEGAVYVYVPECGPVRKGAEDTPGVVVRGASLLALARERLTEDLMLAEIKALTRTVLAQYIGDRPLHTRRLFRRIPSNPLTSQS